MAISSDFYLHDSDRVALHALKAVPGFTQVAKAFIKVWDERMAKIVNMSTNLRINQNQLSKYYEMLPPICEKLGIAIPELYLELDVNANAYTWGDTEPYIVITSGLIETLPEELIPTVLAHECGHIACRHCLYTTMGSFLLGSAAELLKLDGIAMLPIQVAFAYWMRCSELSADRAAAIYDGSSDKTVEMCMRFAGLDKDINVEGNIEEFMSQAAEYKKMIEDSQWNQTMEFILFSRIDHPLNAVRAYECNEWGKTDRFAKICQYINTPVEIENESIGAYLKEIPMGEPSKNYIGKSYAEVLTSFQALGFTNVKTVKNTQKGMMVKDGQVLTIRVNGKDGFEMCEWIPTDAEIIIDYYEPETEEEVAAAHPGQRRTLDSSKRYLGRMYSDVVTEFQNAGLFNIVLDEVRKDKKGWFEKDGAICNISINGQTQFDKGEWFDQNAVVKITFYSFGVKTEN